MSAREMLQAAVKTALEEHAPLADAVTAVFDAPPVRGARPYALTGEADLANWGAKDIAGREGRMAVMIFDEGERPARLRTLSGAAEDAVEAMPRGVGDGWRIATLTLARSRIAREGDSRWMAVSEWHVRMLKEG